MGVHRDVDHHLMIAPLIRVTQLDDSVEEEYGSPVVMLEDLYVLIDRSLVIEDISG